MYTFDTGGKNSIKGLLSRIKQAVSKICPKSHCSFRANRSSIDAIFTLPQPQKKLLRQQRPLYKLVLILLKHLTLSIENSSGNYWIITDILTFVTFLMEYRHVRVDCDSTVPFSILSRCKTRLCTSTNSVQSLSDCCSGSFL